MLDSISPSRRRRAPNYRSWTAVVHRKTDRRLVSMRGVSFADAVSRAIADLGVAAGARRAVRASWATSPDGETTIVLADAASVVDPRVPPIVVNGDARRDRLRTDCGVVFACCAV